MAAMPLLQSVDMDTLHRGVRIVPGSINEEARTFEVTWTTGATVLRQGFFSDRKWEESLSLEGDRKSVV